MKVKLMTALCFLLIHSGMLNAQVKDQKMGELIDQQFKFADQQYKVLAKNVPADVMPKTYDATTGKVVTSNTAWWCSGFFPGSLLYIYEYTQDAEILAEAKRRLTILEKEKNNKGTHDLGFMMYCSFGNGYRLLHDPAYKEIIETSAASLSTRYHSNATVIQSWN